MKLQVRRVALRLTVPALAAALGALTLGAQAARADVYCVPNVAVNADCTTANVNSSLRDAVIAAVAHPGPDTVRLGSGNFTGQWDFVGSAAAADLTQIVGSGRAPGATQLIGSSAGGYVVGLTGAISLSDVMVSDTSDRGTIFVGGDEASVRRVNVVHDGAFSDPVVNVVGSGSLKTLVSDVSITTDTAGASVAALAVQGASVSNVRVTGPGPALVKLTGGQLSSSTVNATATTSPYAFPVVELTPGARSVVYGSAVRVPEATVIPIGVRGPGLISDTSIAASAGGAPGAAILVTPNGGDTATVEVTGVAALGFSFLACSATTASDASTSVSASYSVATSTAVGKCTLPGAPHDGTEVFPPGPGLVAGDPQFVNPATGNWALSAGSPAIDHGDPAALLPGSPTLDLLGGPRVFDGDGDGVARRDAGAVESGPPPPAPAPELPAAPVVPAPAPAPPAPAIIPAPPLSALTIKGSVGLGTTKGSAALAVVKTAPKKLKKRTALITATLATVPTTLLVSLEQARTAKSKKSFKKVAGVQAFTAKTNTLLLRPTGRWNGKKLKPGTYRLTVTPVAGAAKSVLLKVVK